MALFKPLKGLETSLDMQPLSEGYVYFCTDSGQVYLDCKDDEGILIRLPVSAFRANKIYYKENNNNVEIDASQIATKEYVLNHIIGGGSDVTKEAIFEIIYPVGSIYLSISDMSPSILFGLGTWEKIEDTFLLASGPNYNLGTSGGEAEHTLTEDEMPTHSHEFLRHQLWRNEEDPVDTTVDDGYGASNKTLAIYKDSTSSIGGSQAHNNMPPYLAINVWKRVA